VGSNRGYGAHYDRLMDARILERLATEYPLQSLTDRELRSDELPVTRDPHPNPAELGFVSDRTPSSSTPSSWSGTSSNTVSSSAAATSDCVVGSGPTLSVHRRTTPSFAVDGRSAPSLEPSCGTLRPGEVEA